MEQTIMLLIMCAIIAVVGCVAVFIHLKLHERAVSKVKQTMSPEKIAEIDNAEFERFEENSLFLRSKSYIYEISEEENRYEVKVIFHHLPCDHAKSYYSLDSVFMRKEDLVRANLKVGDIVTTIHNSNYKIPYKIKEIELVEK